MTTVTICSQCGRCGETEGPCSETLYPNGDGIGVLCEGEVSPMEVAHYHRVAEWRDPIELTPPAGNGWSRPDDGSVPFRMDLIITWGLR